MSSRAWGIPAWDREKIRFTIGLYLTSQNNKPTNIYMVSAPEETSLLAALKERLSLPDDQVEQDLKHGGEQGLDEATLSRWLRADWCA